MRVFKRVTEIMVLALLGALVIGLSLGLFGSGGSVLTVPILIFILHRPEKIAVAESLAIVCIIALVGAFSYAIRAQIDWRSVFFFGLPGMLGATIGANCSVYVSAIVQISLFACVMLIAAGAMFFSSSTYEKVFRLYPIPIGFLFLYGFLVGCITGLVGIGGGFVIVPVLALLGNLPMLVAIGTSLAIIAMNAGVGFMEQLTSLSDMHLEVSWEMIGIISAAGILGSFFGRSVAKRSPSIRLRQAFSFLIFAMATFILFDQFLI